MIVLRVIYANKGLAELQQSFAINNLHLSAVVLHLSCHGKKGNIERVIPTGLFDPLVK